MREFKFRIFIKWLKVVLEVEIIDFARRRVCCKTESGKPNPCDFYNFDDVEIMQYTGLKDKNGTEIYEGDILKSIDKKDNKNNEWIGVVEDNGFGWLALKYKEYLNPSWLGALSTPMNEPQNATWINSNCIIIGNIYENKNLLDEVK